MTESLNDKTKELAYYKIRNLDDEISQILNRWNYNNIEDFLTDTKSGNLAEASIDDAIELQNLVDTRNELKELVEISN